MKQKEKMAEQDQQIKEKQLYLENAAKALSEKWAGSGIRMPCFLTMPPR